MCDFFCCKDTGTIVHMIEDGGIPMYCNEKEMIRLIPHDLSETTNPHYPSVIIKKRTLVVNVGYSIHPMDEEHFISFIHIETNQGCMLQFVNDRKEPKAIFPLLEKQVVKRIQIYCNVHGMFQLII